MNIKDSDSAGHSHTDAHQFFVREGTNICTLLAADLVNSTDFIREVGDAKAAELFEAHDVFFRELVGTYGGREIDKTDGFLLVFKRPVEAVQYAMAYHDGLRDMSERFAIDVASRVGIHLGEIVLRKNSADHVARGAKPIEVEGLAKPITARIMSVAVGGQTLLSKTAYEMALHAAVGHSSFSENVKWVHHGEYKFKGLDAPLNVYEVGQTGLSPFTAPPDGDKGYRTYSETNESEGNVGPFGIRTDRAVMGLTILLLIAAGVLWSRNLTSEDPPKSPVTKTSSMTAGKPRATEPRKAEPPPRRSDMGALTVMKNDASPVKDAGTKTAPVADAATPQPDALPMQPFYIDFTSTPTGAQVVLNKREIGKTPFRWQVERNAQKYIVIAQKKGYRPKSSACVVTQAALSEDMFKCHVTLTKIRKIRKPAAADAPKPTRDLKEPRDRVQIHVIE